MRLHADWPPHGLRAMLPHLSGAIAADAWCVWCGIHRVVRGQHAADGQAV